MPSGSSSVFAWGKWDSVSDSWSDTLSSEALSDMSEIVSDLSGNASDYLSDSLSAASWVLVLPRLGKCSLQEEVRRC